MLADYAWNGSDPGHVFDLLHDASTTDELLNGNFMTPSGRLLLESDAKQTITTIINAAQARFAIDESSSSLSIEQLAALARVSERTIRAVTSRSNPKALPIHKDGHWTRIYPDDALAWLSQRKDFVPTIGAYDTPRTVTLVTASHTEALWAKWRSKKFPTTEEVAKYLNWTTSQADAYENFEKNGVTLKTLEQLTPSVWMSLAKALGADSPEELAKTQYRQMASFFAAGQISRDIGKS